VNCRVVLLKRVHRSEGKLNICKPSKESVRTCKDYIIGREIAVDNVILELCDLCDYFASPLLKKQLNLIGTYKKETKGVVNSVIIESFISFMPIHIPKKVPD